MQNQPPMLPWRALDTLLLSTPWDALLSRPTRHEAEAERENHTNRLQEVELALYPIEFRRRRHPWRAQDHHH
jgi:hypothetical protein